MVLLGARRHYWTLNFNGPSCLVTRFCIGLIRMPLPWHAQLLRLLCTYATAVALPTGRGVIQRTLLVVPASRKSPHV
jgi:hypothetical protein